MLFFNSVAHSTVMIRRDALKGDYPAGGAEDYALLMELSLRVRMANLPDVLVRYRTWPGALTARTWERQEKHANEIVQDAIRPARRGIDRSRPSPDAARTLSRPVSGTGKVTFARLVSSSGHSRQPGASVQDTQLPTPDSSGGMPVCVCGYWQPWLRDAPRRWLPSLGARAFRLSPTSAISFASKVLNRLRT
jgi:hypothetical protein